MDQTLAVKAYELIKTEIITCALEPGQHIRQSELAKKSEIGMTPVREALQRLSLEGLVRAVPNSGYIVSAITLSDVRELYELRLAVEPLSASLAANRATDQELRDLVSLADFSYVHEDRASYSEYLTLNHSFHCCIADMSRNRRLAKLIARLLDESTRLFHMTIHVKDRAQAMREEHIQLAGVIRKRDVEQANELARLQIESSRRRVLDAIMNPRDQALVYRTEAAMGI